MSGWLWSKRDTCLHCEARLRGWYRRWIGICVDCIYRMQRGGMPLTPARRQEIDKLTGG